MEDVSPGVTKANTWPGAIALDFSVTEREEQGYPGQAVFFSSWCPSMVTYIACAFQLRIMGTQGDEFRSNPRLRLGDMVSL